MKISLIDLQPGDVIYDFGDYHLVKSVSIIHHSAQTINLRTGRDSFVTKSVVTLFSRQLTLF